MGNWIGSSVEGAAMSTTSFLFLILLSLEEKRTKQWKRGGSRKAASVSGSSAARFLLPGGGCSGAALLGSAAGSDTALVGESSLLRDFEAQAREASRRGGDEFQLGYRHQQRQPPEALEGKGDLT